MNLFALFLWSFAAATILPLSSEVPLALLVSISGRWVLPVIVATIGNVLGATTTYWLARAAITAMPAESARLRRASAWLAAYGPPAMLLSWVPLVGDVLVLLAGAARMPIGRFLVWVTVGKAARYVAVALAAREWAVQG